MQVLNICPKFRDMRHSLPADTDTNPSIAHDVCDACLYENPGDIETAEYVAVAAGQPHLQPHSTKLHPRQPPLLGTAARRVAHRPRMLELQQATHLC